jgi:hypothetical protein
MRTRGAVASIVALLIAWPALCAADDVVLGAVDIVAAENGGRVLAASSEAHERGRILREWRKENLIDGKHVEGPIVPADSYGWATETPPTPRSPHWVVFAFAQDKPHLIGAVRLDPRTNDPEVIGRWVRSFRIEVSVTTPDGPWESVGSFEVIDQPIPQTFRFAAPVLAKYVKLVITSNQMGNAPGSSRVSLGEFEVFEALVGDDELTRIVTTLEDQLGRLRRFALGQGAALKNLADTIPPYDQSLISQARGGTVVGVSSEALEETPSEPGKARAVLEQWRAAHLIDGLIATPDQQPDHPSFGWSSNAAPSPGNPEWVIFQLPGDAPVVVDSAVVDTRTRDPWATLRGAREIEISTSIDAADGPWKAVGRWELAAEPGARLLRFPPAEARWVRLSILSNYGSDRYVQLGEFGLYRLTQDSDPLGAIVMEFENILTNLKRYREGDLGLRQEAPEPNP